MTKRVSYDVCREESLHKETSAHGKAPEDK